MASIGPRAQPRAQRHDRDSVVDTALRLLDEVGLADLTMRRLAAALDLQPSALYWHFENKQSLLAAVADRIVADGIHSIPADAAPLTVALRLRTALLSHRDGADIVIGTQALALGAGEAHGSLVRALRTEHDASTAETGATVLLHYLLGHTAVVQQRLQAAEFGVVVADRHTESQRFEEQFDLGVRSFLSGLT